MASTVSLMGVVVVLAASASIAATSLARSAGATDPADLPPETFERVVESFHEQYPDMSERQIAQVWSEQEARKKFTEMVGSDSAFGLAGTAFDARTNTLRVLVSDDRVADEIYRLAEEFGITITVEQALYPADELEALANTVRTLLDTDGAGRESIAGVVVDHSINRVKIGVHSPETIESLPPAITEDPRIVVRLAGPEQPVVTSYVRVRTLSAPR